MWSQIRTLGKIAIMAVFTVFVAAGSASADMSVNGFFPSDYVRTDVFTAERAKENSKFFHASNVANRAIGTRNAGARVMPIRARSGRFSKTTRGTTRSDVQQSEWDVGPILSK